MTTEKICIQCGRGFERVHRPTQKLCSQKCNTERSKAQAIERAKLRCDEPKKSRAKCRRCGGPLPPGVLTSNVRYCSAVCRFNTAASVPGGIPCNHCGRLFDKNPDARRPQLYCGKVCKIAAFKARHAGDEQLDEAGEIVVNDLEFCPRRLAVAKLFDRFEGGGAFDHFEPPTWINPEDRRAGK